MRSILESSIKESILIVTVSVFLSGCVAGKNLPTSKESPEFTFRHGVSLNHWTSYPIDSFKYADPKWFSKKDVDWIASSGIDHIQLYVTGSEIITSDGKIIADKISSIDSFISWCTENSLGVILSPARMPAIATDSTLPREARVENNLKGIATYFGVFANHFKHYGQNVRFLLNIGGNDQTIRNRFFQLTISEIRRTNPIRELYITAYSIDKLSDFYIPESDENITIATELSQSTEPKAEAIDVFAWQHQDYFFSDKMPPITFPGNVPSIDTTMITDLGRWAIPFSNAKLDKDYFDIKFEQASKWIKDSHPKLELYVSHFRYWTGYPFDPKSIKDEKSVNNFISSFSNAAKRYNINWCFYDYNSGSSIRQDNGEKSFIFKALQLVDKSQINNRTTTAYP